MLQHDSLSYVRLFFHSVDSAFVKLLKYSEYKMHIGSIAVFNDECVFNDKKINSIQACLGHNGMLNIGLLNLKTPGGS